MSQFLNHQNGLEQSSQSSTNGAATAAVTSFPMVNPFVISPMFFSPFLSVPNLAGLPVLNNNLNSSTASTTNANLAAPQNGDPTDGERLNENAAQNNNENDGEPPNNWLDIFWNTLIFLSLISASFTRSLFVLSVSFVYYLYQSGFFGTLRVRWFGGVLRNVNNENNRNLPNNEEQIQQMMDENLEAPGLRRRNVNNDPDNQSAQPATDPNNNQHFVLNKLRFVCMVISSLFSSLMPDNGPANVVPGN